MPQPGYKQTMTEDALRQRQEAPLKHGAFSKKMTPEKVSRLAELEERLTTQPGLVEVQREQTAKAIELTNVIMSWVVSEHKKGKSLDRIPALNKLASYMNAANRAIWQLHKMTPDSEDVIDAAAILEDLRRGQSD